MSKYPFHLRQEILLEKGAAVLAELFCDEREYRRVWRAKRELSALLNLLLGGDGVLINGDEYRRYHGAGQRLHDSGTARETSVFASAVTERLIDTLSDERRHLIVEGTGRTVDVPWRTAELLTTRGYAVELVDMELLRGRARLLNSKQLLVLRELERKAGRFIKESSIDS